MTLLVLSAHTSSRDPDRLDITRAHGGPAGAPFAPSWATLRPALTARAHLASLEAEALFADRAALEAARAGWDAAWAAYVEAYLAEMEASQRRHPDAWRALLARPRVVLACRCSVAEARAGRCHRAVLRARILPALGARDGGELP